MNPSKQELGLFLTRERPVTDAATLFLFESLFQTCAKDSIIADRLAHAWERAAAVASGNNVWLYQEWFEVKIRNACYKDAKQVSSSHRYCEIPRREPAPYPFEDFLDSISVSLQYVYIHNDVIQAAMAWMKAYPQQREPFYLYILLNLVISKSYDTLPTDRKLCQMLAYKALEKAAADTEGNDKQLVRRISYRGS